MALRTLFKLGALSMGLLGTGLHCNGADFGQPGEPTCTNVLVEKLVDSRGAILEVRDGSTLNGARLEIRPNALTRPTLVRLTAATELPSQGETLGPALCVQLEAQQQFAEPAFLVLPYSIQQLGARVKNYLAVGARREGGQPAAALSGLTAVDEESGLLATRITEPGHFQAITRGDGALAKTPNLDVLFVIDNSGSMTPKQQLLAREFSAFFDQIARPAHFEDCIQYHIGVTTTDVGRTASDLGDDGNFQTTLCKDGPQKNWSPNAMKACKDKCVGVVDRLAPGERFLARDAGHKVVDLAMQERQFQCLAIVGDAGSGNEAPLQSLVQTFEHQRKTLDIKDDYKNFFRKDAATAIVFITDEDDCSMPADPMDPQRKEFYAQTKACSSADPAQASCYAESFRCLGVSLQCDHPLTSRGMKTGCMERVVNPILRPVKDYVADVQKFLHDDLGRMGMFPNLFIREMVPLAQLEKDFTPTIAFNEVAGNLPPSNTLGGDAFCSDLSDPAAPWLGHPQLRLSAFAQQIGGMAAPMGMYPKVSVASICKQTDRENVLRDLATTITNNNMLCKAMLRRAPG